MMLRNLANLSGKSRKRRQRTPARRLRRRLARGMEPLEDRRLLTATGWSLVAGGADWDRGFDVAHDTAGNAYVTGHFRGDADFDSDDIADATAVGEPDLFVAKYSSSGSLEWLHHERLDNSDDAGLSIAVDPDTNTVVVAGYRNYDGGSITGSTSSFYLASLDAGTGGDQLVARTLGRWFRPGERSCHR